MAVTATIIGARIRRLRQDRGLRLTDVAEQAGFTKGFLSKVERGKASPPIATLIRIAAALDVDPSALFEPVSERGPKSLARPRAVHVTPATRVEVPNTRAGPGYSFMALAAQRDQKQMEPFLLTVDPSEVDPERIFEHPGEEFIFVLKGQMDYRVGDEVFSLRPGDSLYFDGEMPHSLRLKGKPVTFLAVFHTGRGDRPSQRDR